MKKSILALSLFAVLFTSCDKDEPANITPTTTNLVGTYQFNKIAAVSGTTETDVTSQLMACNRDDQSKLNANMSYNYIDAGTVCSPSDSYSGTWALTNSTTFDLDGDIYTIRRFNGKSLEVTQTFGGVTYVTYFTKL